MKLRRNILNADKIKEINDAVIIIRHFVDLSARLLPFLSDLSIKKDLTNQEQEDKNKVITVFNSYNFDTSSSDILLESPILELIKDTYQTILVDPEHTGQIKLEMFRQEYRRLKNNWKNAIQN